MAIEYHIITLWELLMKLEVLSTINAKVRGLDGSVHSDRGYYDRAATTPTHDVYPADDLYRMYSGQVGGTMHGWKGGEYQIDGDKPVAYAEYGSSGPYIAGLEKGHDGIYELIVINDRMW